nr:MAG TPA: Serum amyloid A-2 protein-amyloidosis, Serum Amyloid A, cross-beta.7A [Caudoviricetes sp.]
MYLGTPKVGCSGICDYYFHCQGCCALKYIIGSEHKCYTLKVRRL